MKDLIRSYITFTRPERIGLVALCGMLVILIAVKTTMHLWVSPATDDAQQQKLQASLETYERAHAHPAAEHIRQEHQDAYDEQQTPLPDIIDLNTADSATLVRLKGIGPATAHNIIMYRNKKGPFTNVNQLTDMGHFSKAGFFILKKHLTVGISAKKH